MHPIPKALFDMGLDLWRSCGTPEGEELFNFAASRCSREVVMAAQDWIEFGAPRLTLGHHHAAGLICTRVPEELLSEIVAPWPCFMVDVPPGLLDAALPEDVPVGEVPAWALVRIVSRAEYRELFPEKPAEDAQTMALVYTMTPSGRLCGVTSGSAARMCTPRFELEDRTYTAGHERLTRAVLRLVGALLVELSAEPALLPPGARERLAGAPRTRRGEPTTRTFAVRPPTGFGRTTDFRGPVREWVSGKRRSPVVQGMVCAHFRNAPCGPGGKDRRVVRVWSYWRGPEEAPIALHARVVRPGASATTGEPTESP